MAILTSATAERVKLNSFIALGALEVDLLPQLMIEMLVFDEDAGKVMKTICDAARTGRFGDSRIFVCPVEGRAGEIDIIDNIVRLDAI